MEAKCTVGDWDGNRPRQFFVSISSTNSIDKCNYSLAVDEACGLLWARPGKVVDTVVLSTVSTTLRRQRGLCIPRWPCTERRITDCNVLYNRRSFRCPLRWDTVTNTRCALEDLLVRPSVSLRQFLLVEWGYHSVCMSRKNLPHRQTALFIDSMHHSTGR